MWETTRDQSKQICGGGGDGTTTQVQNYKIDQHMHAAGKCNSGISSGGVGCLMEIASEAKGGGGHGSRRLFPPCSGTGKRTTNIFFHAPRTALPSRFTVTWNQHISAQFREFIHKWLRDPAGRRVFIAIRGGSQSDGKKTCKNDDSVEYSIFFLFLKNNDWIKDWIFSLFFLKNDDRVE